MRAGQEIGSYVLESPLGKGGMGEVYLARHKSLGTRAAVKVLAVAADEPQFHERFSREAKAQAQLSHPNVARVLDHVQKDGRWYLITEYMPRGTLKDVLDQSPGPVPPAQALAWTRQALRGLEYAHRQGIVHRDVKPANILINEHGEAAMTDFGLAQVAGGERLTQTGTALGTPAYMSPEQISGDQVDGRTDVYSMGVVLYELLTGRVPFPMKSASEVVRVLVNEPPPLRQVNPDLSRELESLVMRALAKDPNARYADCGELATAIERYERGEVAAVPPPPPLPRPPLADVDPPQVEPTVVVAASDAARTPPPRRRGASLAAVAAILALLAIGGLALAAGAAYYVWPMLQGRSPDAGAAAAPLPVAAATPPESPAAAPMPELELPLEPAEPNVLEAPDAAVTRPRAQAAEEPVRRPPVRLAQASPKPKVEDPAPEVGESRPAASHDDRPPAGTAPAGAPRSRDSETRPNRSDPPLQRRPPLPERPVTAVIALGDPLFAGAFEAALESRLRGAGLPVADERNSLVVADLLRRWGDDVAVPELLPPLAGEGFHVVVVAQVELVGFRELYYLGRYSQATQARLRLNAYLIDEERALGSGWSEAVEYTELNAAEKAGTAMFAASDEMAAAIHRGWQAYR